MMSQQYNLDMIPSNMARALKKANELVKSSEDVKIYSHIDCDGISAGAILSSTLDRLDVEHDIEFISLDKIPDLRVENELTIFSDLASGQPLDHFPTSKSKVLILDHHPPLRPLGKDLKGTFVEINPSYWDVDGSYHVSGGGMSYLLARTFSFYDLSWIGVLSAVGDVQNSLYGKLIKLNRIILNDAIQKRLVKASDDLAIYGRQTRPLYVALSYFGDFKLPITNHKTECIELLKKIGIPKDLTLSDLSMEQKNVLFSELIRMLSREVPTKYAKYVPRLVFEESYEFLDESRHTPLRDASEFSTAVNACSKHDHPEVAFKVLKGNRGKSLDDMMRLARDHRKYLAQSMEEIQKNQEIESTKHLQYFNGLEIKPSIIGTVAGMLLTFGEWEKPMLGFTEMDDRKGLKVSLRCSRLLAFSGIHFGKIINKISHQVGGSGGGHSMACGAYIPITKKDKFLKLFDLELDKF